MLDEERSLGARLLRRSNPNALGEVAKAVHQALAGESTTRELRWYTKADWDAGRLDQAGATPV
jgi:hypothetical protein